MRLYACPDCGQQTLTPPRRQINSKLMAFHNKREIFRPFQLKDKPFYYHVYEVITRSVSGRAQHLLKRGTTVRMAITFISLLLLRP